jgi:16S rRNA (guanine1516-N2)-methyltransferase
MPSSPIVRWCGDADAPRAQRAFALGARAVEGEPPPGSVLFETRAGHLQARLSEWSPRAGVRAKWSGLAASQARERPTVRALGRVPGVVLDATAGLGGDAVAFAAAGWRVVACERSPWVAWLLEEGLAEAAQDPARAEIASRVTLEARPAEAVLAEIARGDRPPVDVVFLDPMFPIAKRRKHALPPKEAQLLRALVPEDPDAGALLAAARRVARRVAVKRPPWAPPLAADTHHSIETKLLRVDVYEG